MNCIIIDDEPLARAEMHSLINEVSKIEILGEFSNAHSALDFLKNNLVDFIFLDIEMPSKNGMDFYKNISQNTKVIFTTAYSEYAVDAFSINAVDYLLKPFSFERFKTAVEKVKTNADTDEIKYLSIRADYKLHKINFNDILLIEGLDDYIQIHLTDHSTITARSSMKNILEKLSEKDFVRVHRSYIVPVQNIKTIVNRSIHIREFIIPIGETYKDLVMKIVNK